MDGTQVVVVENQMEYVRLGSKFCIDSEAIEMGRKSGFVHMNFLNNVKSTYPTKVLEKDWSM